MPGFYPRFRVQNPCDDSAMILPEPGALVRRLLGRDPDRLAPLTVWSDTATYRVGCGRDEFVVKVDDEHTIRRETLGQRRALAAGIPAPEIVAADETALVMRFVDGVALADPAAGRAAWADAAGVVAEIHRLAPAARFGAGFGGTDESVYESWGEFFGAFAEQQLGVASRDLGLDPAAGARIRRALADSSAEFAGEFVGWCHGDCHPDHILVDPVRQRVVAVIDWADHGTGAIAWDLAVLTIDHPGALGPLPPTVPLYQVIRHVGEACWFAAHDLDPGPALAAAEAWRPGD
jgi:aminoglycoside phosphotransferase (APT) family kinase protein